jgi:hypothetical protein
LNPKQKPAWLLKAGSSFRSLKGWIPKTPAERRRENLELDRLKQEMEATLQGLSPELQAEIRDLANSKNPREAEQKLIDYVVTEDHFKQQRKQARRGYVKREVRMHDWVYWLAFVPALLALYVIFNWLSTGHLRFWKP